MVFYITTTVIKIQNHGLYFDISNFVVCMFRRSEYELSFQMVSEVILCAAGDRGGTVVKVLCYKSEGRWFDPSWCHWNFSLT